MSLSLSRSPLLSSPLLRSPISPISVVSSLSLSLSLWEAYSHWGHMGQSLYQVLHLLLGAACETLQERAVGGVAEKGTGKKKKYTQRRSKVGRKKQQEEGEDV